tara:strand:- start:755 stop:1336 length:582 start_codon:yes stop_codon:yes gene_type:complete
MEATSLVKQELIIISGPIAVGKSYIIKQLVQDHAFSKLGSGAYLVEQARMLGIEPSRLNLVKLGDQFHEQTDFAWVVHQVAVPAMTKAPELSRWVFDSVRKRKQVTHFRDALPDRVFHVHFTAPEHLLKSRYESRNRDSDTITKYAQAIDTDNEREARTLCGLADLVVDTSQADEDEATAQTIEGFLKWSKLS